MASAPPLQHPYDRALLLPRGLRRPALITAAGRTDRRLADVRRWRDALRDGELPSPRADFGARDLADALRAVAAEVGIAAACRARDAVVEQFLLTLLWHMDRLIDLQPRLTRAQAIAQVAEELRAEWTREQGDWEEMLSLLQDLSDGGALQWDRLRGRLRSREWREARRASEQLAQLPEIVALIRRLGRSVRSAAAPPAAAPQPADARRRRIGVRVVETRIPDAPGELRGVRHGARIEGMLGSEAALLMHPVGHKLWRARRAEARLLTYDTEAVLRDLRPDPTAPPVAELAPPPEPLERGPIILCLDTSGSMRGAPEIIAKAVALEALRTAHRERRGCLLIAFGGESELLERELGAGTDGLLALFELMGQSFDGGTDVQAPVERAIARVREGRWAGADLLIVSDGEFGCVPATLAQLDEARQRYALRVQGVLVGDRETLGLMEVCDDIHWVRDWRRHAEGGERRAGFSPVHSKSLTALYFPNALSTRAARHHPDGTAQEPR